MITKQKVKERQKNINKLKTYLKQNGKCKTDRQNSPRGTVR